MKDVKKIFIAFIALLAFILSGCSNNLKEPTNLRIDEDSNRLYWDSVEDATGYVISINNKLYESTTNYFALDRLSKDSYLIRVKAKNENKESAFSLDFSYYYDPSNLLSFKLNSDDNSYMVVGKGGYKDRVVAIPDSFKNLPVTRIAAEAFSGYNDIATVILGNSIKYIDDYAFKDIPSLEEISFNEGLLEIGEGAFQGDVSLKEVILPNSVKEIGEYAFSFNKAIESLILPSELKVIRRKSFSDLESLKELIIPNSVEVIEDYAFSRASSLAKLTLSKNLKSLGESAFYEAKSLEHVKIPGSLKKIGDFSFASAGLKSVLIDEGVEAIGKQAFYNNKRLSDVEIPSTIREIKSFAFDESKFIEDSDASVYLNGWLIKAKTLDDDYFVIDEGAIGIAGSSIRDNIYLKEVVLPKSLKYIGEYNFYNMKRLSKLNLGSTSLEYILEGSVSKCLSLDITSLPKTLKRVGRYVFNETIITTLAKDYISVDGWLVGHKNKSIDELVLASDITGVSEYAFSNYTNIKRIKFNENGSLKYINNGAFNGLVELVRLDIPNSVIEIGEYAFSNLTKLDYLSLPKDLRIIERSAFNGSEALRVVILPEKLEEIRDYAFYGADIRSLELPKNLKYIGKGAFYNNESLANISFNEGLKVIDSYAFSKAVALNSLRLPQSLEVINDHAFFGLSSLTSLDLGGTKIIGDYAFYDARELKKLDLNSVEEIGMYAFSNNNSITSLTLGESLKRIGDFAFSGYLSLKTIIIKDEVEYIGGYAFSENDSLSIYMEGFLEDKNYSYRWNSSFRPVIEGITLNDDNSLNSFIIKDGIINLNSFTKISMIERDGYLFKGFSPDPNGEAIYKLDNLIEAKNIELYTIYEKK